MENPEHAEQPEVNAGQNHAADGILKEQMLHPLFMTAVTAVMALFFGFDLGGLFAFKTQLMYLFMLDGYDIDGVFGVVLLGALAGAFLGGFIISGSGRKSGIISGFVLGVSADCAAVLAPSFSTLLLAEFALGGAMGIFLISSIIYACEISLPVNRGMCCALPLTGIFLGVELVVVGRDLLPESSATVIWGLIGSGLVLSFVSAVRLPESPRWLAGAGYNDAALSSLIRMRRVNAEAARELAAINERSRNAEKGIAVFLHSGIYRSALWCMVIMTLLMHVSGMTLIPYAALEIIGRYQQQYLGYFYTHSYDYGYGFVKAAATVGLFGAVTALLTQDRLSRSGALLAGTLTCMVVMMLLIFSSMVDFSTASTMLLSALVLIYIYAAVFAVVIFVGSLLPELLPSSGREFGVTLVLVVNFVALLAGIKQLKSFFGEFDVGVCFGAMFMLTGALLIYIYSKIPNTSGQSLESIENRLFEGKLLNQHKVNYNS